MPLRAFTPCFCRLIRLRYVIITLSLLLPTCGVGGTAMLSRRAIAADAIDFHAAVY